MTRFHAGVATHHTARYDNRCVKVGQFFFFFLFLHGCFVKPENPNKSINQSDTWRRTRPAAFVLHLPWGVVEVGGLPQEAH